MQERGPRKLLIGLALGLVAWLTPGDAAAQTGKITGVVTDAATGQPIEGVQVIVQGTTLGAVTQANGRYFIISVSPGTYTVTARRIGYQSVEVAGLRIGIDVTREQNFRLTQATAQLQTQRIVAEATPLVERGTTGSTTQISAEVIQSLPVTSVAGVLALQQGFVDVPANTSLQSASEEERSTVSPVRVRGGRGGSTLTLIDGIPINNPLFGTDAIRLNALAVQSVDFSRGYMEPQYGNALSGVINQAVREGGAQVAGSVDYQTSGVAGALGSDADDLRGYHLFRGFLSGPVPGTAARLRYSVSGQIETGAAAVYEYDNDFTRFSGNTTLDPLERPYVPANLDLIPGWRAFGGRQNNQVVGKLTFLPTASTKINLNVIGQQRQTLGYDRRYMLVAGGDPWRIVNTTIDSLGVIGNRNYRDVLQASVRDQSQLYGLYAEQRLGRTSLQFRAARTQLERNTCNIFLGVCVTGPFTNANFNDNFIAPFAVNGIPYGGTQSVYGGEDYNTTTLRFDGQSQVTDHHQLQAGVQWSRHDLTYSEVRGISGNSGPAPTVPQSYRAKPIEAATYLQDRIEYDFLTVKLGFRYDYGIAKGRGFTNPLDPSNGTTIRDVCEGTFPGQTRRQVTANINGRDTTLFGTAACFYDATGTGARSAMATEAIRIAQTDDFTEAKARTAFSPRLGISFPLTERSMLFFNAGRYTMNPLYANLYRNSGIGTVAGKGAGTDNFCNANEAKPGTNECVPPLTSGNPDFIGNPNLRLEEATQYEVGYGAEFGRFYSFNLAIYNRDETGLSGLEQGRATNDPGLTYANQSNPAFYTLTNRDFLTSRGLELQVRRRISNYWGYDFNYGYSHTTTNSPPPDRGFEILRGGEVDRTARREFVSEIDQPHRFNATLLLAVAQRAPDIRFGQYLRNTSATVTYRFASGLPYTPIAGGNFGQIGNTNNAGDPNSGRAPGTHSVDLLAQKSFDLRNVRYGAFVRVENLLDTKNCVQVFVNTGDCTTGLRDFTNRRVGNTDVGLSTTFDQPEYIGTRRSIFAGLSVNF